MATKKKQEKEIVRAIRFNDVLFEPGQEDELEDAMADHADADENFDQQAEVERLTRLGALVGFADVDEEDFEEQDADRRAAHQSGNRAVLQHRQPLARQGRGARSMDEVQHDPDENKIDFASTGGKPPKGSAAKSDRAARQKAEAKAREQKAESEVVHESEQIPVPGGEEEEG